MTKQQSQETGDVEVLLDRYAALLVPRQERLAKGRDALLAALVASDPMAAPARRMRRPLLRGWSMAAAFALLLIGGAGIVVAESGPGQPFYGLRLAIGSITLPGEELAHERGLADQLDDRLTEVGAAARIGDGAGARAAIDEYLHQLTELSRDGVNDPAILALLRRHQDTLQALLPIAPSLATEGVQLALDAASKVNGVVPPTRSALPRQTPPQGPGQSPPATGKP